jgi:hypothetical protein
VRCTAPCSGASRNSTLAGQDDARISATAIAEADSAFGLLEPSLAGYAAA